MKKFVRGFLTLAIAVIVYSGLTGTASAVPPTEILDGHGDIECTTQGPGPYEGQTWCGTGVSSPGNTSSTPGVQGVPIDINVALPATGEAPYPVVLVNHGNGEQKFNFDYSSTQHWLNKGYAVYSQTSRGFGYTCLLNPGDPGCEAGYSHMMDFRYEVRDAQNILGLLADEGLIEPKKIATTGNSYGGGMSMSLAVLRNRVMDLDGSLHPWKSPGGKDLEIVVAAPLATWTDFNYAMAPNGTAADYIVEDSGYYGPTGVMKESYIQGLISAGRYAPAGTDPQADVLGWKNQLDAGEPYDTNPAIGATREEVSTYHSSFGLPPTQAPAPVFFVNGFTDDIFPVNEATRFYNRTRSLFPQVPVGLFFGSLGHPRGQVQANVFTALWEQTDAWVDYYLAGVGSPPVSTVTTYTQTCPNGTAAAGPYTSFDWATIAPGEIRLLGGKQPETIDPNGGDFAAATQFNPLSSILNPAPAGTACAIANGGKEPGSVNYETDPAPAGGYTVMGASTVIAKFEVSDGSQVAARLVDVSPDGSEKILVSRGLWRPDGSGFQVFQLFANGWKVEPGHVLRLELLPRDSAQATPGGFLNNYGRPSNAQKPVKVSFLDLRIPVLESPGALNGLVEEPAPRVLPDRPDVELAKGNEAIGSIPIAEYARLSNVGLPKVSGKPTVKGKTMRVKLLCPAKFSSCPKVNLVLRGKGKLRGMKKPLLAKGKALVANPGQSKTLTLKLTGMARKVFRDRKTRKRGKTRVVKGLKSVRATVTVNGKKAGTVTVKRVGKVR